MQSRDGRIKYKAVKKKNDQFWIVHVSESRDASRQRGVAVEAMFEADG